MFLSIFGDTTQEETPVPYPNEQAKAARIAALKFQQNSTALTLFTALNDMRQEKLEQRREAEIAEVRKLEHFVDNFGY